MAKWIQASNTAANTAQSWTPIPIPKPITPTLFTNSSVSSPVTCEYSPETRIFKPNNLSKTGSYDKSTEINIHANIINNYIIHRACSLIYRHCFLYIRKSDHKKTACMQSKKACTPTQSNQTKPNMLQKIERG